MAGSGRKSLPRCPCLLAMLAVSHQGWRRGRHEGTARGKCDRRRVSQPAAWRRSSPPCTTEHARPPRRRRCPPFRHASTHLERTASSTPSEARCRPAAARNLRGARRTRCRRGCRHLRRRRRAPGPALRTTPCMGKARQRGSVFKAPRTQSSIRAWMSGGRHMHECNRRLCRRACPLGAKHNAQGLQCLARAPGLQPAGLLLLCRLPAKAGAPHTAGAGRADQCVSGQRGGQCPLPLAAAVNC